MSRRTRLTVAQRREQLLELGRRAFAKMPYDQVNLEDIARQAQVSRTLVYHYFPTKRQFYLETVKAASGDLRLRTAPDESLNPFERLRASLDGFIDYIEEHGDTFKTLIQNASGIDSEVAEVASETRHLMMTRVLEALGIAKPPPTVRVALLGWVGFVENAALEWIDKRDLVRDTLRDLFAESLKSTLETCQRLDPRGFNLPELAGE
jgi:AcrR family transcriptional regulator